MDFLPFYLCDSFRLHEAACLMAGVSPISKRVPSREELPPHAIPYYVKLAKAYFLGAYVFDRPEDKRFQRETLLIGNSTDGTDKPDLPGSIEKLTGELVSRAELQRWIEVVGIKSVYLFAPVVAQPQAVEAKPLAPPMNTQKRKRSSAIEEVLPYLNSVYHEGKFRTIKDFIKGLVAKSGGGDSPFKKSANHEDFFCMKDSGKSLSHKVIADNMKRVRENVIPS